MYALIVSFDSLATNSIGCYGNEWIETPHLDRLAATGAIFDRSFVDSIGSQAGMAWSNGRHPLSASQDFSSNSLGHLLKSSGVQAQLIAAGSLQPWQQAADFHKVSRVQGNDGPDAKPDEIPFAQVVREGISALNESPSGGGDRLLWLHAGCPGAPPAGFDELYFEDFEERGQQIAELPDEARVRHPAVYAGSVSLLDHWLGELIASVETASSLEPLLLIVTAASGFLWQEIISPTPDAPSIQYSPPGDQLARTPMLLKVYGDARSAEIVSLRSDRFVQACDLVPTLIDWFGKAGATGSLPLEGRSLLRELIDDGPGRPFVLYGDGRFMNAVRTPEWLCVQDCSPDFPPGLSSPDRASLLSLYVKPEDVWEVNNVASQQPEIVDELMRLMAEVNQGPENPG